MLSYATDIKPLFRSTDIETMRRYGLDLGSYKDVQSSADEILSRLEDGTMPCDGRWQETDIDKFRRWMQGGKLP